MSDYADRFWEKVEKRGPNECWEWQSATLSSGYGAFSIDNEAVPAHRVAFRLEHGSDPEEYVCHRCDNKTCVNPNHLYAGTHADNTQDALDRDRYQSGESHYRAKLTAADVQEIRDRAAEETQSALAEEYGIDQSQVSHIVNEEDWNRV